MNSITKERLEVICEELINHLAEAVNNEEETYSILKNCIGLSSNEIDQLAGDLIH